MSLLPEQIDTAVTQHAKKLLRQEIRLARRALPAHQHARLSRLMSKQVLRTAFYQRAKRIGLYFAVDGEIDVLQIMHAALREGKQVYLPVLAPDGSRMHFVRYMPHTRLRRNRFGIPEPWGGKSIKPQHLDLVLMPLVAFDPQGHRLGMGGGYYDRTFAFLRNHRRRHPPLLLGIAYELQKRAALPWADWDVPLAAVATEARLYRFAPPNFG